MFAIFYRFANTDFRASHQALLSGSGLPSVAGSDCHASHRRVLCPRGRNRPCASLTPFGFNSRFADSILLAFSQTIA
jgi:hypothetical protein